LKRSATRRAYVSSFASRSRKATEKVLIGSATIPLITAAMADESMPPERNIPSGTSAISRNRTDVRNNSAHSSMRSASRRPDSAPSSAKLMSQYRSISICPSSRHSRVWPGGSRLTPSNSVSAEEVPWLAR
jgi:hypothetical protein